MNYKWLLALAALAGIALNVCALADEEICVACDKKVLITGHFSHRRALGRDDD